MQGSLQSSRRLKSSVGLPTNVYVSMQLPRLAADLLGRTLGPLLGTRQQRVVVPGAAVQQQASAQQQQQQQQQQLQQRRRGGRAEPNGRLAQVKHFNAPPHCSACTQ